MTDNFSIILQKCIRLIENQTKATWILLYKQFYSIFLTLCLWPDTLASSLLMTSWQWDTKDICVSPMYLNPRSNKQTHMIMLLQKTYQPIVISDTLDTCYDQKHLASSLLMTSWQWASFICCCIASGHLEAPPIKANLFAIQRSVNFNLTHGHFWQCIP